MRFRSRPVLFLLLIVALFLLCLCVNSAKCAAEETEGQQTSAHEEAAAKSADDPDGDAEDEEEDGSAGEGGRGRLAYARAIFPKCADLLSPTTNAGSALDAVIAYRNVQPGHKHTLVLVTGHLTPLNAHNYVLQNFSVVRHVRHVQSAETVTIQYSFTPDEHLEPDDYNLVLGVYFHDNITNTTHFAAAFNGTMTVDESLRTDPKTILTYITLLAMFSVAGYFAASKTGLLVVLKSMWLGRGPASSQQLEVGTDGQAYDPDYISGEHQKYKDSVLSRSLSSTMGKKSN